MNFRKRDIASGVALALSLIAAPSRADWTESTDISIVRPAPGNLQTQAQNPPAFAWAKYISNPKPASYKLEIWSAGKVFATFTTTRNFYLPSTPLPPGQYSWRVRPDVKDDWSTQRSFVIDGNSKLFVVPESVDLKPRILAHSRPRQLTNTFKPLSAWTPEMRTVRGAAVTRLASLVTSQAAALPRISDANWPVTSLTPSAERAAFITQINRAVGNSFRQLEAAAFMYRLTAENKYLQEALLRGDELAAFDPNGMTSYINHDQASRNIMIGLAKAADLLGANLDSKRRATWMAAVVARVTPMYVDLSSNNSRLDEQPYDSHGTVALGYIAVIAALTLGDIPAAQQWFDFAYRAYVNSIYVWSGAEGGFSNGTAYGMYSTDFALQLWQPLSEATGVDLFKKPWAAGFARYLIHFLPPGAPGHVFGDQREYPIYLNYLKGFASRIATANAAWYVKNLDGVESDLTFLEAPYPMPVDTVLEAPAPPPSAALYPSIGWVAMHSNIADRARTSVYFKSSPYGSYNHSHGDQNTLVIDSGGRRLLTEAGYEDYYYSPLVQAWYRQTKAHNGITYNGGIGQLTNGNYNNLAAKGQITSFSTTPTLDYAEGNATPAYGTALTSATRKVWYLRGKDVVVVLDKLAALTALTFEWNMHAAAPITILAPGKLKITNVDRSLCISSLSADPNTYQKRAGPASPGRIEDHGAFVKTAAAKTAEFLVLLDVGCKQPVVSLTNSITGRTLKVGDQSILLPN